MAFRVELSNEALTDAEGLYEWLTEAAPVRGPLWFSRLMAAIQSLQTFPQRCAYAAENERFPVRSASASFRPQAEYLPGAVHHRTRYRFRVAHPWPPTSVDEAIERSARLLVRVNSSHPPASVHYE